MKIDMSSEAISQRLHAMDELWLLSVKLMKAKLSPAKDDRQSRGSAIKIYDAIREVLFKDWDPIGISNNTSLNDEYDAYIAPIYRILVGDRSKTHLIDCLGRIEREKMGLDRHRPEELALVAEKLLGLEVNLVTDREAER